MIKNYQFCQTRNTSYNERSTKHYFITSNVYHRLDGPAIEHLDKHGNIIYAAWYFNGKFINCSKQEEFIKITRFKAFL